MEGHNMKYDGIITKPSLNELYHHGIKGQKWGVKNGPPYPLDRGRKQTKRGFASSFSSAKPGEITDKHYIKKGTKMYRVSSVDKENNVGETYVTYNPVDRAFYRAYIKSKNPGSKVYETTFKANQDLVVPSQKELAEVQTKVILNNPKLKKLAIEGFSNFRAFGDYRAEKISEKKAAYDEIRKKVKVSDVIQYGIDNGDLILFTKSGKQTNLGRCTKDLFDKVNTAVGYERASQVKKQLLQQIKDQKISDFSVVSVSMGTSKELKQAMIKELRARGYNSMVDEAGVGALEVPGITDKSTGKVSREGVEPIIVFDRSESLKPIKTREVKDASYDYQYYRTWRGYKDNAYRKITW